MIDLLIKLRDNLYTSYIKNKFGSTGKNFFCQRGLSIQNGKKISIGESVTINRFCNIKAVPEVIIGNNVLISNFCILDGDIRIGNKVIFGPFCHLISDTHDYEKDISKGKGSRRIIIGNNVWIASNVKILKGVNIGDNCVIGAGSVVDKNVPNNSMVAGIQARIIRKI